VEENCSEEEHSPIIVPRFQQSPVPPPQAMCSTLISAIIPPTYPSTPFSIHAGLEFTPFAAVHQRLSTHRYGYRCQLTLTQHSIAAQHSYSRYVLFNFINMFTANKLLKLSELFYQEFNSLCQCHSAVTILLAHYYNQGTSVCRSE